jgi:hypothetical protein
MEVLVVKNLLLQGKKRKLFIFLLSELAMSGITQICILPARGAYQKWNIFGMFQKSLIFVTFFEQGTAS